MATCNASSLLAANPFTQLDPGLQDAVKLQLLCDISANGGGGGGGIGGSGTAGNIARFTAATTLGNSSLTQSGSNITQAGKLSFSGTTHEGLVLNALTTVQRDAIVGPSAGSLIWNTTTSRTNMFNGSSWTSGWVRLEGDTMTGSLGITQGAITADSPALNITSTYNNAGVTFGGAIKLNVTDTASNAASLLADFQVGGVSQFAFAKSGLFQMTQGTNGFITFGTGSSRVDFGSSTASQASIRINGNARNVWSGFPTNVPVVSNGFGWHTAYINLHNSTGSTTIGGFLTSEAANSISQVNSTSAQTFQIYNTYSSSTSHERGFLSWVSNEFRIGTEKGSGGGTARAMAFRTDGTERMSLDTSGNVIVNTAAIATNATNGFLYVPGCAGTPTGVPTSYTGRVPIVVDTTNNKLYFYSGAAWRDAGP